LAVARAMLGLLTLAGSATEGMEKKVTTPAKLSRRLSTQDASFLYGESESGPLHFGGLGIFQGVMEFSRLLRHVEQRLDLLPRFRQRLAFAPLNLAHPTLEDDPEFRIENHVFCHELPEGTSQARMTEAVLRIFEPRLDRGRPLWEMHLFHGLEGGRSAVLWKVHHCIVDGVSWVQTLTALFDFRRHPAPAAPPAAWEPKPVPGAARLLGDAAIDLARVQIASARRLVGNLLPGTGGNGAGTDARNLARALRPAVAAPWNRGLVTKSRSFAWIRHPQDDVRVVRKAFGGTLNDVVLAALGEGAARYLKFHGCDPDSAPLRIGCPVSVRSAGEMKSLGNRVSMMLVELAAEPGDPVARLRAVSKETQRIKSANEPDALDSLSAAADLVPPSVMSLMSSIAIGAIDGAARLSVRAPRLARLMAPRFAPINFIATNVRGPQLPAYLAGKMMLDYVGMIPLGADLGCGVVISTYNRNLYLALMAEPRLMPDVDLLMAFVDDAFEELKIAADATVAEHSTVIAKAPQQIQPPAALVGNGAVAAAPHY
jgi:diacylglycerol O-acyltransferase / wax synthase